MPPKVKGLYGLALNAPPFNAMGPEEIVAWVKATGANLVFFTPRPEDMPTLVALQKAGIKVCLEISLFVGETHWKTHPTSRPITAEGKPIEPDAWYHGVCPNQTWLWVEKLKKIKKLGEAFPINGVWLDFIRYPCHWEVPNPRIEQTCFCLTCRCLFQSYPGMTIPPDVSRAKDVAQWILKNHEREWTAWKCERIAAFCKLAKETLRDARPGALLGAFTVPWKESDFDGAIHRVIAQDYAKMAEHVDVFSPMVYHRMCGRPVEWIADFTAYAHTKTRRPVWPIIQACNQPGIMNGQEFEQAIQAALRPPSDGVILYSINHILQESRLDSVKRAFQ